MVKTITETDVQVASALYPVLVKLARDKQTVTYKSLIEAAQNTFPNMEAVQTAIPVGIGRRLDVVRMFLDERNLPDITSLVINNDTGEVGSGFGADPKLVRQQVFNFDWGSVTDEFDLHIDNLRKVVISTSHKRPALTRPEALRLISEHYQANKKRYPPAVVAQRERLVKLVMWGAPVEEAFDQMFGG